MFSFSDIFWGFPLRLRWSLYHRNILKRDKLPHYTIGVGSIVLGGAAKTPMVEYIAHELIKQGRKPAVLTRGYGRKKTSRRIILRAGKNDSGKSADYELCGDEPLMLSRKLPDVPIVVHPNRCESAIAVENDVDSYILDDGFQHLCVRRDLDIVMLTGNELKIGIFPFGERRDGLWRLHHLGECNPAIAVYPCDVDVEFPKTALPETVKTIRFDIAVEGIHSLSDWENVAPLNTLDGKRVFLAAGIARPRRFVELIRSCGLNVVGNIFFRDHFFNNAQQVQAVIARASETGADAILTTQKDAVRIEKFATPEFIAVKIAPVIDENIIDYTSI